MPTPQPKDTPDQSLPPPPVATDLRTGTEVHPEVVAHHAAFLQGAPYDTPYGQVAPPTEEVPSEQPAPEGAK